MTDEENKKDLKERVDDITHVNFQVNECPLTILKKFKDYAKQHTRSNYPMAIERLLEIADTNAKDLMIWESILDVRDKVAQLELHVASDKKEEQKARIPTIGNTKKRVK